MNKFRFCLVLLCGLAMAAGWSPLSLAVPALPQMYVVEVIVEGQGTVEVDRSPLIHGPTTFPPCAVIYYADPDHEGVNLQWTGTAAEGWRFDRWVLGRTGDLAQASDNPTTLALIPGGGSPSFWTVRAVFVLVLPTYTLTMAVAGNGTTAPTVGAHTYDEGTVVPLTATPDEGWVFDRWSGDVTGSINPTAITMTGNKLVAAHFVQALPTQYTLTMAVAGNGTTTPTVGAHTYDEGTVVPLTATPDEGWVFDRWSGDVTGSINPTAITMTGNKLVAAHFVQALPTQYTLTMAVIGNGTTTPTVGAHTYDEGTVVPLIAIPDEGWVFGHWNGHVTGSMNPTSITMTENKWVTAHFVQAPPTQYTLTVNIAGSGTVTKTPDKATYQYMSVVSLDPTPSAGWQFVEWSGDLSGSDDPASITMDGNKSVTAHFAPSLPQQPPPQQQQPPADGIDDNVEAGPGNWTAESLWGITDRKSHSPTHSWWFGNERTGTYGGGTHSPQSLLTRRRGNVQPKGAGSRVQGALASGAVSVRGWGQTAALSFHHWRHVEYYPDAAFDRTYVQVTFDGALWRTVWSQDSQDPSQKEWEQVSIAVPIQAGATLMRVRFVFDTIDGLHNDYPGWFIDDIRLGPPGEPGVITVIAPLISGMVGQPYGPVHLAASGGVPPYTWTWRPAVPGLDLAPRSGTISGTPTTEGEFSVTITVRDSAGESGTLTATIIIGPSIAYDCLLFTEDFTDVAEWTMSSLWHIASDLDCIACASMIGDFAYFGRECSFATGVRVAGALRSPAIDIPDGVEAVVIRFDQFRHVESDMGSFDRTWMEISFDERTWEKLWHRDSASFSPQGSHEQVGRAVPAGADRMWIRFRFDSVDRFYNDFPGWAIDNIKVLNAACVPGFQPSAAPMIALPQAVPRGQISVINSPNPITDVNTTVFTVRGVRAEALKIQIFDLSGALVFEREVVGNELTWHTDNNYGEYLANGVYLYRALVRVGREWIVTGVRKLVILR